MNLQIKRKNTYSDANHTQHISSGSDWSLSASRAFSQHTKKYRQKFFGCSHCCWYRTMRNGKFKKANPQQTKHWVFALVPACLTSTWHQAAAPKVRLGFGAFWLLWAWHHHSSGQLECCFGEPSDGFSEGFSFDMTRDLLHPFLCPFLLSFAEVQLKKNLNLD